MRGKALHTEDDTAGALIVRISLNLKPILEKNVHAFGGGGGDGGGAVAADVVL